MERDQLQTFAGGFWHPSLSHDVPVRINRAALQYDHILILGPTFPHEVAGFSGGAKYLFPGISGPEMIHTSHWLGALVGIDKTIGVRDTPVRAMIHAAAAELVTPVRLASLVIADGGIAGLFIGDYLSAWRAAADLSARRHIRWHRRPFRRVLSCAAPMYDELWTAAKAVYKLAPAVAESGELILYAPHLETVSRTHDRHIDRVGYHVLDYFLKQWKRFDDVPLGVLAHSTHVRGAGWYVDGIEMPRVRVVLASRISRQRCQSLALEYLDPADVDLAAWQARADAEGPDHDTLFEPYAGELLHRVGPDPELRLTHESQ